MHMWKVRPRIMVPEPLVAVKLVNSVVIACGSSFLTLSIFAYKIESKIICRITSLHVFQYSFENFSICLNHFLLIYSLTYHEQKYRQKYSLRLFPAKAYRLWNWADLVHGKK